MGFLFSQIFWGVLLIIIGASVVIRAVFHINIPIFSMIVAFILIYGGIRILIGGYGLENPKNTTLFHDSTIYVTDPADNYNTLFGKGVIDLTKVNLSTETKRINIHTIFGASTILLNPETPVRIIANSAFADARMPNGNQIQFGTIIYQSKTYQSEQHSLLIDTNVVFGGLEIMNQQ
jgi:predicted membrane protein